MRPIATMSKFAIEYGKDGLPPPQSDGSLDAPAYHRNHEAIWTAMAGFLDQKTGNVLELGSGTGQHVVTFAQKSPRTIWWPSDVTPTHLASITAWRREAGLANVREAQRIDLMDDAWAWQGDVAGDKLSGILCINVIHISPWRVAENLMVGARCHLREGGTLFMYGPYKRDREHTAPSNAAFDASLRARNPEWGVRDIVDVTALAKANGLILVNLVEMPANNLMPIFQRR
jgi:hypothetical protein